MQKEQLDQTWVQVDRLKEQVAARKQVLLASQMHRMKLEQSTILLQIQDPLWIKFVLDDLSAALNKARVLIHISGNEHSNLNIVQATENLKKELMTVLNDINSKDLI